MEELRKGVSDTVSVCEMGIYVQRKRDWLLQQNIMEYGVENHNILPSKIELINVPTLTYSQ